MGALALVVVAALAFFLMPGDEAPDAVPETASLTVETDPANATVYVVDTVLMP